MGTPRNPHQGQPVYVTGTPLEEASAAVIMIHGRGATAESILSLVPEIGQLPDVAYIAPQAAMNAWYPQPFIAPIARNEPWLSSALEVIGQQVQTIEEAGIPADKIMLLGFSQGACLAAEYVARNPKQYGGLAVLSGGLIGPDGDLYDYQGTLEGTPVFLGCSDVDFHIPLQRVNDSAEILSNLGAKVDKRLYPNMGHTVNEDEIIAVSMMQKSML